ncbi:MAG: S8 family peptidase [Flavobacteriales bacterium]|nr:S8 family peptidase [Flavobacteriales bacterium]
MTRYILALSLISSQLLSAQTNFPSTTRVGLSELQGLAKEYPNAQELTDETQGYYPTAMIHGRCMVGFLGKVNGPFDASALDAGIILQGTRKGSIVSFRIDAYHLDAIHQINGLIYCELAGKVAPTLDKVIKALHADSVHMGINLPSSYTGNDVLIGITDWGFDYTHPMFYDTALTTSRVRAAWDHYRQSGPAPSAFPYGTELTTPTELLLAGSDTVNIYGNATHGSHVAGIAGGGGAGTYFRGVAFEAQYLFCTFLVDAAAVIDAFEWMQTIAEQDDKRLVINMSWGLHWIGTLDGNSLISQAIDQFSQEGVVFVNSAGNNGDVNFHIKKVFAADTMRSRIQFYPYSAHEKMWGQSISMWGEAGSSFSTGFTITSNGGATLQESPWYFTSTQVDYVDSFLVEGVDTVFYDLTTEAAHPLNGRPHFRLRVKNTSAALKITLKAAATSGTVHFWNVTELTNDVGNWGQDFQAPLAGYSIGDKAYGISEPACTESVVSVAAYSSEYQLGNGNWVGGSIANFSSFGPTMDERSKPDVTAPGVTVASSISSFTDNSFTSILNIDFQGRTYPFARFSGTSMSAPATTGVVALILEADPTLTPADVRDILRQTARVDQNTGTIPTGGSTRWGYGKVNAYQAVIDVLGVVGVDENSMERISVWPNPTSSELNISVDPRSGIVLLKVVDITGRVVQTSTYNSAEVISLSTATWSAGVYGIRIEQDQQVSIARIVKQ